MSNLSVEALSAKSELRQQIMRFGLAGLANVGVDLSVYIGLMHLGVAIAVAKAAAFICGTLFAYWANRVWTFKSKDTSLSKFGFVIMLYMISMVLNVSINSGVVAVLGVEPLGKAIAYTVALVSSATLNFMGMRFAFKQTPPNLPNEDDEDEHVVEKTIRADS